MEALDRYGHGKKMLAGRQFSMGFLCFFMSCEQKSTTLSTFAVNCHLVGGGSVNSLAARKNVSFLEQRTGFFAIQYHKNTVLL